MRKHVSFHKSFPLLALMVLFVFFHAPKAHAEGSPELFNSVNYAGVTLGLNTGTAADDSVFFAQADFQYNLYDLIFFAGVQGSGDGWSITGSVQYWPFTWNHFRLGAKLIYNLDIYGDISITNNILPGLTLECQPISWFAFRIDAYYLFKGRYIYALGDNGFLPTNTFAFNQRLYFYLPFNITLSQYVATYGTYRYTQPADLVLGLEAIWDMNESWQFSADITSRQIIYYIFTTSFNAWEFKLSARYKF